MRAAEIRERFASFFERNGHLRVPSASLVPSSYDPWVLLTTAGMQPFKPYFRGEEEPPSRRLTSCQKSFRTVDIEVVGTTKRHLTFFEMLGNFSVGDYFKQGAAEYAWELSTRGFGFDPDKIWISVFGGDEGLGLGPDSEAIAVWRSIGVPDDRIVLLGREDNFWQAGPTGPCGPCSELYYDRGPDFGPDTDRPGDDTDRMVEYWNLVFMQYDLQSDGSLPDLPFKNIDTGMGLDHPFLPQLYERVVEVMGESYPDLKREWPTIERWARAEEESFGRTLEQGERLLADLVRRAKEEQTSWVPAEDAFKLHDTYGFPYEMTRELLAEQGLSVDDQGFEELMEKAREVSRSRKSPATASAGHEVHVEHDDVMRFARRAGFRTRFVGYETTEAGTRLRVAERANGWVLAKLEESPFYPEGGGQVSDTGHVETPSGRARVADVYRLGDDQALALEPVEGDLGPGEPVRASVERATRLATMRNHTATHLLHAALRERLGTHVRQAGSYVGPDKLRFDFTHGGPLTPEELRDVEDRVNREIVGDAPVRALTTTLEEARSLGAMALFGEKYGDVVRMVEIGDGNWSRELCGGTHVRATAEIGAFRILSESSSAANVRRIEAVTGPVVVEMLRRHDSLLRTTASLLRSGPDDVPDRVM